MLSGRDVAGGSSHPCNVTAPTTAHRNYVNPCKTCIIKMEIRNTYAAQVTAFYYKYIRCKGKYNLVELVICSTALVLTVTLDTTESCTLLLIVKIFDSWISLLLIS
jgi:hypothetical protein